MPFELWIAFAVASAAVLMVFMLEPVIAWWAGTWGAEDVMLFKDVDDDGAPTDANEVSALLPRAASPAARVQRALGRPPRDFADYCAAQAATGIWGQPI